MRTCGDCREYVIGDNGRVSTYPAPDPADPGNVIELPMRVEPGTNPPCGVCPKIPAGRPKSWEHAAEFGAWFWDLLDWFAECRAVGDFGTPDPLMRALAAAIDRHERRAKRDDAAAVAIELFRASVGRR